MNRQVINDEDADNGYFVERSIRYINHVKGIYLCPGLSSLTECTVVDVFADVLIHAFPVILTFDKMIGSIDSLVSQFVRGFNEYYKMPGLWDD